MQPVEWEPAPNSPDLTADEIHVWRAALDSHVSAFETLQSALSPDELERAARFKFELDRKRFVVARGVLRNILAAYVRLPPAQLHFHYNPQGKPALATRPEISFNLAHSQGLAVYAFGRDRGVGVDVERIRSDVDVDELARRTFTQRELTAWRTQPALIRAKEFFTRWTCKEAYTKARGLGLGIALDSLEVDLAEETGRIRVHGTDAGWLVLRLFVAEEYPAALVYQGVPQEGAVKIRFFSVGTEPGI